MSRARRLKDPAPFAGFRHVEVALDDDADGGVERDFSRGRSNEAASRARGGAEPTPSESSERPKTKGRPSVRDSNRRREQLRGETPARSSSAARDDAYELAAPAGARRALPPQGQQ